MKRQLRRSNAYIIEGRHCARQQRDMGLLVLLVLLPALVLP